MTIFFSTSETNKEPRSSNIPTAVSLLIAGIIMVGLLVVIFFLVQISDRTSKVSPEYDAAKAEIARENWNKAIELLQKSLKSRPKIAEARILLAKAYLNLGNLKEAMVEINKALEIDPKNALAYGIRGIIWKMQKNNEKALEDLAKAVKLQPDYSWAYAQTADIFMRRKDFENALKNVDRAIKIQPDFVECLRLRAMILARMGKCKEASDQFDKVQAILPNDATALQDKAWFLLTCPLEDLRDKGKGLELAKKANELTKGQDSRALETLAEAYFQQGQFINAVENQKKAIDLEAKKCPDESCLGEMKKRLQKYEIATRKETRPSYDILPKDPSFFPVK